MAKQILQTHDQTFSARPPTAVTIHTHRPLGIVFASPGPHWKLMRQFCMTDFFSPKRLKAFMPVRTEEVGALMRSILNLEGAPVSIRGELHTTANNITSRMVLGKRLSELATSSQADPSHNIVALILEMMHLLGVFNVGDYIPSLAWMDLQGYVRRSKVVASKISTVFQEVIDGQRADKRRSGSNSNSNSNSNVSTHNFLDGLLLLASENTTVQITDDNIKTVLLDMFGGGIDTSSITIEWALAELLTNPTKMKMVQEELVHIVGMARLVQESDIPHLPYFRAVVKETMRLHPILPFLVPHMSSQPCQISGYHIPTNTMAYVNVWAIGRDPNTWEKPFEFCPERFLDSNVDVHGQHFELLPFGSGRRGCPGWMLGLLTVQIVLANLIHGFTWKTIDKPDMSEKFGIIMTLSNPLVAKATPKLQRHLFESHK